MRYEDYLKRPAWKRRRLWHLKWAGFRCALCGKPGADTVHHITYAHRGNERHSELLALHASCHEEVHQWFAPLGKGWNSAGQEHVPEVVKPATGQGRRRDGTLQGEKAFRAPLQSENSDAEVDFGVW